LEGGEGIGKEEVFMWRGKERKMRETGIDGKWFNRKYGGRVPEVVVGDDGVACSGSWFESICKAESMGEKFINDAGFDVLKVTWIGRSG